MKNKVTLLCGVMLVLGLLMGGLPASADYPAEDDHYVLTIVDCPEDLDETVTSWNSVHIIDGTLYEVRSYYLGRGKWCFAMEAPEQRRLTAEEATHLMKRAETPDDPPLLVVVDCPNDLDETVPSWTVMKRIDNTLYRWREYYLGDGKWCIVLERPEHRRLTAHEATLLWEKSAGIGREPTTRNPDDWVLGDPADQKDVQAHLPVVRRPAEKPYSGEPDTGAPPHRLSPPVTDCHSEAGTDQSDFVLTVEAPDQIRAGEVFTLKGTLEYVGEEEMRLHSQVPAIRFFMFDGDGEYVANDLFARPRPYTDVAEIITLDRGWTRSVEDLWRIAYPGEYQLVVTTSRAATGRVEIAVITVVDG